MSANVTHSAVRLPEGRTTMLRRIAATCFCAALLIPHGRFIYAGDDRRVTGHRAPTSTIADAQRHKSLPTPTGAFFALSVRDFDATLKWYRAAFDLPPHASLPIPASNGQGALLIGPGVVIEIVSLSQARVAPRASVDPSSTTGIFKVGLQVPDLAPFLARFRELEIPLHAGPFDDVEHNLRSLIVEDNEGNLVHLVGPIARR